MQKLWNIRGVTHVTITTGKNDFIVKVSTRTLMKGYERIIKKLDETSVSAKNAILDAFSRIGLDITDLRFEGVDTTPEFRDRLFWLKQTRAPEEVLRMETVKEAAKELGKSSEQV
jgi:predicted nuclease of restriction endonuclease-like RecB superfamily